MRGRKPLPSKVIELKGGSKHTHRPPRTGEPKPPSGIPLCPKHLDKEARKIWKKTAKILSPVGIITKIDVAVLARYCQGSAKLTILKEELNTIKNPVTEYDNLTVRARQYRIEYERWNDARKETAKGLFKLEGGKFIENPYLKVERQSFTQMMITENKIRSELNTIDDQMRRDEVEMGMTPSSRSRVKVAESPKSGEEDEKRRFFK